MLLRLLLKPEAGLILFFLYSCNLPENRQTIDQKWNEQTLVRASDAEIMAMAVELAPLLNPDNIPDSIPLRYSPYPSSEKFTGKASEVLQNYEGAYKGGFDMTDNFQLIKDSVLYTTPDEDSLFLIHCYFIPKSFLVRQLALQEPK